MEDNCRDWLDTGVMLTSLTLRSVLSALGARKCKAFTDELDIKNHGQKNAVNEVLRIPHTLRITLVLSRAYDRRKGVRRSVKLRVGSLIPSLSAPQTSIAYSLRRGKSGYEAKQQECGSMFCPMTPAAGSPSMQALTHYLTHFTIKLTVYHWC